MASSKPSSLLITLAILLGLATMAAAARHHPHEKTTHFHFYFHDSVNGANVSAIRVVEGPASNKSTGPLNFGDIVAIDDPLTEGPNLTSKLLGRAQGLYALTSLEDQTIIMTMNFLFLQGEYNGSTIAIIGRNPYFQTVREFPIVGGTGKFRMARGYVLDKTYSIDLHTGNAILVFDVYVTHHY